MKVNDKYKKQVCKKEKNVKNWKKNPGNENRPMQDSWIHKNKN